jgi:hypothetical protein
VTDGDTADPALATSNVEIAYNQVVGCVSTGIALAMGLDQIAHDNTVVSGIFFNAGLPHTQYERSQRSSPQGPLYAAVWTTHGTALSRAVCGAAFLGIWPLPEQAEKYWNIRPATQTNLVAISA